MSRFARTHALLLVAVITLVVPSGCNVIAPLVAVVEGPPKIAAVCQLPDVKTVVFVDDRDSVIPLSSAQMRQIIAQKVTTDLLIEEVVTEMIDARDAQQLASRRDRHGEPLSLAGIGRGVGAEQLIYIEMRRFSETPDGVTPRPTAQVEVKVLDLINDQRLFPDPAGGNTGHPVNASLPEIDPQIVASTAARLQLHRQLAEQLGESVGKMFYKHQKYEVGDRLK